MTETVQEEINEDDEKSVFIPKSLFQSKQDLVSVFIIYSNKKILQT